MNIDETKRADMFDALLAMHGNNVESFVRAVAHHLAMIVEGGDDTGYPGIDWPTCEWFASAIDTLFVIPPERRRIG